MKEFEESPGAEIVLITGHGTIETAVEAMRHGASDYLVKPVDFARVRMVLANVDAHARAEAADRLAARASCASSAASGR